MGTKIVMPEITEYTERVLRTKSMLYNYLRKRCRQNIVNGTDVRTSNRRKWRLKHVQE
jgi:hypothetical protein